MGKEERNTYTIQEEEIGQVQIADEVVAIIAGLAAMEVDGVLHGRHIYERSHQQAWKEESLQGSEGGRPRRSGDRIFVTEFAFWEEYHGGIFQGTGESQGRH